MPDGLLCYARCRDLQPPDVPSRRLTHRHLAQSLFCHPVKKRLQRNLDGLSGARPLPVDDGLC